MGELNLHISPQKNYYYFKDQILSHLESESTESYIYILPVNRAVRYFKKELIANSPQPALLDPPVYTFSSLIQHLYRSIGDSRKIISKTMKLMLVEKALEDLKNLKYFRSRRLTNSGLVKKIDGMLGELCQFGFQPDSRTEPPTSCANKFDDFLYILKETYNKYDEQLTDSNTLIIETIKNLNETSFREIFSDVQNIYINGYGIYTPPMMNFINHIKQWCNIFIKLEYDRDNQVLFQHTFSAFDALSNIADNIISDKEKQDFFSASLFKPTDGTKDKKKILNNLQLKKIQNRNEEVTFIAAKIKHLHLKDKIPLYKIGITFPNLEMYVPLIRSIFKEYEIPFNLSTGFPLSQSPLVQSFLKVIKVVLTNFDSNEILGLLTTPFLSPEIKINFGLLKDTTIRLRLKNINKNWQKIFSDFIEFKKSIRNEQDSNHNKNEINDLKQIQSCLSQITDILHKLNTEQSIDEFHDTFLEVLKKLGLLDWYNNYENLSEREREKEFRAFNKFINVLDQMLWILKYLHGKTKVRLGDYYKFLKLIIEESTYNLREWSDYGVQIMPRLEIQSTEPKILFIGGLVEGEFPRRFSRDIFFNDEERNVLGLHASEDLLSQDRFLFYQLISSQADKVILTYPAFENDSGLLPSTFLSNLHDISEIPGGENDTPEHNLLSKSKLTEYLGGKLRSDISSNELELFQQRLQYASEEETSHWLDAIDIHYTKKSRRSISRFEGNLINNKPVNELVVNKKANRPFSITALESYAFCPMQFYLERVINLKEEEEFEESITPLERGSLVHTILFRFYSTLKKIGKQAQPWKNNELLVQIAYEEFSKLPYKGLLWTLEKEKYFGNETEADLFDKFLEVEKEQIERTGFIPSHFEYSFGRSKHFFQHDPESQEKPLIISKDGKDISIYGKIDRIDINEKGQAIVYDYKTGSDANIVRVSHIFEGTSLQLPVYIKALEKSRLNINPIAGGYFQAKDADNCERKITFVDNEKNPDLLKRGNGKLPNKTYDLSFNEMIDKSVEFVIDYVDEIFKGNFRHTQNPNDSRCSSYCAFSKICRKDIGKIISRNE